MTSSLAIERRVSAGTANTKQRLLFLCMMLLMAFDFRRGESESSFVAAFLSLASVCCGAYLIAKGRNLPRSALKSLYPILFFIAIATISGIVRGNSPYAVLASGFPLANFCVAALAVASLVRSQTGLTQVLNLTILVGLATAGWKFFFALTYEGLLLSEARHQVLSGATPMVFGYAATAFLYRKRKFAWASLCLSVGPIAISVTRSYILICLISTCFCVAAIPPANLRHLKNKMLYGVAFAVVGVMTLASQVPDVLDRWVNRIFVFEEVGFDITSITRIGEIEYQLATLNEDTTALIFGSGFAAETKFSDSKADLLASVLGKEFAYSWRGNTYGHNLYIGLLFVGGVIGGPIVIFMLAKQLVLQLLRCRQWADRVQLDSGFCMLWGGCSLAGYMGAALTSGQFGDRSSSFFFGLSFGFCLIPWKRLIVSERIHDENMNE